MCMKTLRERNDEEEFASHCDMVSPMCLPEVDGELVAPQPPGDGLMKRQERRNK